MSTIQSLDRVSSFVITIYVRYVPAVSRFRNFFFSRDFLFLEASRPDERVASRRVIVIVARLFSPRYSISRTKIIRAKLYRSRIFASSGERRFDLSFLIYRFFLRRPPVSLAMARYTTPLPLPTVAPTTNSTNNTATPPRQDNEDGTVYKLLRFIAIVSLSLSLSLFHKKRGATWRGVALLDRD